jgi:hypothetical protein
MAKETISSYSMAEIRKMIAEGDYWPTSEDDLQIELDEDFWRNAKIVMPKRRPGLLKGEIGMAEDFDETPDWLVDAFEGGPDDILLQPTDIEK